MHVKLICQLGHNTSYRPNYTKLYDYVAHQFKFEFFSLNLMDLTFKRTKEGIKYATS